MKTLIIIILSLSVIHLLHSPSEDERLKAQQQRMLQLEKELLARNLLLVRQDIDNKLSELKSLNTVDELSRHQLMQLKTRLENENKMIRSSMVHEATYDSWMVLKRQSVAVLQDTQQAFKRLVKQMENPMMVKRTILLSSQKNNE